MTQRQKNVIKKYRENKNYALNWVNYWFAQRWNEETARRGIL
jgi:hypothetical protein